MTSLVIASATHLESPEKEAMAKKKASKKKASKTTLRAVPPPAAPVKMVSASMEAEKREVDPNKLSAQEAQKRCKAIYDLEKRRDGARIKHDASKRAQKAAKVALDKAQAELDQEIADQRFGPGPLFDPDPKL